MSQLLYVPKYLFFFVRDVASRNCLVNAQRVVKLGDFGMTRPMYENDYYKFNRKGERMQILFFITLYFYTVFIIKFVSLRYATGKMDVSGIAGTRHFYACV